MKKLTNPVSYLDGVFAPVSDEIEQTNLEVYGDIPDSIHGIYVQNNPNPYYPAPELYHWFDGDGMIHGVQLEDGQATYRNRYVATRGLAHEKAVGSAVWKGLLNPIEGNLPGGPDKNTANTDLIWHNGQLLATWWLGGQPYGISIPDLATTGPLDFGGTLQCGVSAHPKVDPRTGELIFFDYSPYAEPFLQYGVVSADGHVVHHTPIEVPGARLFHDIALTENFTVFFDLPMLWDPVKIAQGKRRVRFDPSMPSRFGIIPRMGTPDSIRWFETSACYMYHAVNAYERRNAAGELEVVVVGCRIENPMPSRDPRDEPDVPRLYFLRMDPYLWQWAFNLETGAVSEVQLDDVRTEFPRMNDRWLGQKARYAYHQRLAKLPTLLFDGVTKYDLEGGGSETHVYGKGLVGGETVFVARPGAVDEDDGWLLCFVNGLDGEHSELRIIDAQQMTSEPVARVIMPRRVPVGFHADWAPGAGWADEGVKR